MDQEQTVNERILDDRAFHPIDDRSHTVRESLRPERRPLWTPDALWLPREQTRVYGPLEHGLEQRLGVLPRDGAIPWVLHPQCTAAQRRLARGGAAEPLAELKCTPTSSVRSVLAWNESGGLAQLKLSMGAVSGRTRRALREAQVVRGTFNTLVIDRIPREHAAALRFDLWREPAGMVETSSGQGWLLRTMPERPAAQPGDWLLPAFSMISRAADGEPRLVDWIRQDGGRPERFVVERVLAPFITVVAYLLLEQGLEVEPHGQNVLFGVGTDGALTGEVVLRDLSDTSLHVCLRLAKDKPCPVPAGDWLPAEPEPPVTSTRCASAAVARSMTSSGTT